MSADFHLTHDFAFKPSYSSSWRSRRETHQIGPAETLGVHLIDLIHYFFGPIEKIGGRVLNLANTGEAPDTSSMFITTESQVCCTIHTSYAAPVAHYVRIVASELVLTYRDGILNLQERTPSDPGMRSSAPRDQTLLRSNSEELSGESLFQQLRALYSGLTDSRCREIGTAYQGIANVAVLGGFEQSLQQGTNYRVKDMPVYRHCAAYFG